MKYLMFKFELIYKPKKIDLEKKFALIIQIFFFFKKSILIAMNLF